jgi:hypothetical protein
MCESDADSLQHAGPHLAGTDPADAATPKPILNSADSFRRQHVAVHEADPEENSDPRREREHREIRNQPSTPAIRELSSGRSPAAARYLAGKRVLSTASASLATQGLNEQISREKGVKELLVERTISIRRHATATLTRLENK